MIITLQIFKNCELQMRKFAFLDEKICKIFRQGFVMYIKILIFYIVS